MKGRIENGNIKLYKTLPAIHKGAQGVLLNFKKASKEVLEANGYFDVIKPSFDARTQDKSGIYFSDELNAFTYDVNDKVFTDEDLLNVKLTLKSEVRKKCGELLKETDWKVIRQVERGVEMSDSDKQDRLDVLDECDRLEIEIEAIDNYIDSINYKVQYFPVQEEEIIEDSNINDREQFIVTD